MVCAVENDILCLVISAVYFTVSATYDHDHRQVIRANTAYVIDNKNKTLYHNDVKNLANCDAGENIALKMS